MRIPIINALPGEHQDTDRAGARRMVRRRIASWTDATRTALRRKRAGDPVTMKHGYRPRPVDYREGLYDPLWMRSYISYPHRDQRSCA